MCDIILIKTNYSINSTQIRSNKHSYKEFEALQLCLKRAILFWNRILKASILEINKSFSIIVFLKFSTFSSFAHVSVLTFSVHSFICSGPFEEVYSAKENFGLHDYIW